MEKIKKIIGFVLALLNFLFHFKPTPNDETLVSPETYPTSHQPPDPEGVEVVFETIP